MSELVMVEQRRGSGDAAHWIREGGRDDSRARTATAASTSCAPA